MNYSKIMFFAAATMLFFTNCKKETLDLSRDTFFGVKELFESKNCDVECGEVADCEGENVKVTGVLDERNINESDNQFYVLDKDKPSNTLEVKVDESISAAVFAKLNGNENKTVKVEGVLEGFDASTNSNCERMFFLQLTDSEKVTVE